MKAIFKNAWGYQGDSLNLPVRDLGSAVPFYESSMGFRFATRTDGPPALVVLERDGIRIGLSENGGDPEQDGCAFEVDDVEAALAEFKAKGLDGELSEIKTENRKDGSVWRAFFVVAPDGLCFWVGQRQT
jgi:catechol 2,3-dioxygenase-like lactoylglutathione lyase family enzyme